MRNAIFLGSVLTGITIAFFLLDLPPLADASLSPGERPQAAATGNTLAGRRHLYANGIIEGRGRNRELRFEVSGRIASLKVRAGDRVEQGCVLARLDTTLWEQQLAEAEAQLALAQAERRRLVNGTRSESLDVARAQLHVHEARVTHATSQFQRSMRLQPGRTISAQQVEDDQVLYETARAELQVAHARLVELEAPARDDDLRIADARVHLAEAAVGQARTMLAKANLVAPCSGLILDVKYEEGELIEPTTSHPIVSMTDDSARTVRIFVEEFDSLRICAGDPVRVSVDGFPELRLGGTLVHCYPVMVPKQELRHKAGERTDVKVREAIVLLKDTPASRQLVIGLPVDVFISPQGSQSQTQ